MELAKKILQEEPQADGIYAADILGTAFWKVLKEQGRRVPEDFEIISTDGVYENTNTVINLSAVISWRRKLRGRSQGIFWHRLRGRKAGCRSWLMFIFLGAIRQNRERAALYFDLLST